MTPLLKKTAATICATGVLLFTASTWADQVVPVASLEVKDRIRTLDQINVSAETDQIPEAPSTKAVADLLDEAEILDAVEPVDAGE